MHHAQLRVEVLERANELQQRVDSALRAIGVNTRCGRANELQQRVDNVLRAIGVNTRCGRASELHRGYAEHV